MNNDFSTIDWIRDTQNERNRLKANKRITGFSGYLHKLNELLIDNLLIIGIGSTSSILCFLITKQEQYLAKLRFKICFDRILAQKDCAVEYNVGFIGYVIIGPLYAVISAIIVTRVSKYAGGSGIPGVKTILGGFIIKKFLGVRTLIAKYFGLSTSVASGLSLGKEGPLVHLSSCIANIYCRLVSKYKNNAVNRREIVSAACAAGVAVAFGAPIGGVLFSLEEVSYYFPYATMYKSFYMAMVSSLTLQLLNPYGTGKLVLFQVDIIRPWHHFELPIFMILGVLGGIYGALFIKSNLIVQRFRKFGWLTRYPVHEVLVLSVITAISSYPFDFTRAGSGELVGNLFRECLNIDPEFKYLCANTTGVVYSLLYTIALKSILTVFTFGTSVPAGVFVPSMVVGASVGRLMGILIEWIYAMYPSSAVFGSCNGEPDCVMPGHFAIVGAAAFLAGVTRMTVSLVVIMFELTGAVSYTLPIMLTVVISKWIGELMQRHSIYDALIVLNRYPYLETNRGIVKGSAKNVMTFESDLRCISDETTLQELRSLVRTEPFKGFPITASNRTSVGYIVRQTLVDYLKTVESVIDENVYFSLDESPYVAAGSNLRYLVETKPVTVHPNMPLEIVVELFGKMGLRYVFVTRNGVLLGIITKKDLLRLL